jgi:osmotically-inducible protein OsmY
MFRRGGRRGAWAGRGVAAEAYGLGMKATHLREQPKEFDDVTLASKVESEVFRSARVPKGGINLNAVDGVVYLRGEVDSAELIDALVNTVRRVQGVKEVKSLLHLPGEPAPSET